MMLQSPFFTLDFATCPSLFSIASFLLARPSDAEGSQALVQECLKLAQSAIGCEGPTGAGAVADGCKETLVSNAR